MTPQKTSNKKRLSGRNLVALSAVGILFSWVLLCFCSFLPFVLFMSLLFNAVFLGSSLFSTLAQEREKRTIDALRLTQLTSTEILMYKANRELNAWKWMNGAFLALAGAGALMSASPLGWALGGAAALAAGGLLSISLALAVSTRCETTSSAVVNGWVTKGVWLVGLPILDYVVEAVAVLSRDLNFFSYLDPAWIFGHVLRALIFETSAWSLVSLGMGAVGMVGVAVVLLVQSSRIIDSSFESAATLDDRSRHPAYGKSFIFGLHKNPFMVRELVWQMRTGAGAWPGYAVFLTLFLAPFLYGLAQQSKSTHREPVRIVRHHVAKPGVDVNANTTPSTTRRSGSYNQENVYRSEGRCGTIVSCHGDNTRYHSRICISQLMGLPVPTNVRNAVRADQQIIVQSNGKAATVSGESFNHISGSSKYVPPRHRSRAYQTRTNLERELDRGLLTGLLLTLLYLFIRGGAFMSGAVTGEKERRAWDQIALTGVSPQDYLTGKLSGVLYFPLKQLLYTSPVLILFGLYGGISLGEVILLVPMLVASFLAAACIGLVSSTTQASSHQAQGQALVAATAVLMAPLVTGGWLLAGAFTFFFLRNAVSDVAERTFTAGAVALWFGLCGAAASPIAAAMQACQYSGVGPFGMTPGNAGGAIGYILIGTLSMTVLAYGAFKLAVKSLEQGGSVKA